MEWVTGAADKAGALGRIVSAASRPACCPALAGLGALAGDEGLLINILLAPFAAVALIVNALGWLRSASQRWCPNGCDARQVRP